MTLARISGAVQRAPHAVLDFLGAVPSTNVRILATLGMAYVTTFRYVTSDSWTPSVE